MSIIDDFKSAPKKLHVIDAWIDSLTSDEQSVVNAAADAPVSVWGHEEFADKVAANGGPKLSADAVRRWRKKRVIA